VAASIAATNSFVYTGSLRAIMFSSFNQQSFVASMGGGTPTSVAVKAVDYKEYSKA